MSDFNKVLAFQQMMPYLNKEQQEELANTLDMDLQEINRRLVGKNKEDEFVLILLFMEVCKSITGFDEGVSQLLKTATSDLLVELKNGNKFMLEIKHTDKQRYAISMGNLQKRIDYAEKHGLELFFAVSIKGYWMLFNADYLKGKNGKIEVSDMTKSKLDEVLGCVSYIFPKDLRIKTVYSASSKKTIGVKFEPYGEMVSYELYYKNKKIFRLKGQNSKYLFYTIVLEALHDRLANDTQKIEQVGDFTIINESFSNDFNMISEYKFLLSPIEHTVNDDNERLTAHTYIEQAKVDENILKQRLYPAHIRMTIQNLVDNGVEIMYMKNNLIHKINPQK